MRHTIEALPTQTRTTTRNRISFDPAKDNLALTLENIEPESLNTDRTMTDRLNTDRKSNTLRYSTTNANKKEERTTLKLYKPTAYLHSLKPV